MGLLVLFGTGLFGIVLSVGSLFAGSSDPGVARFLHRVSRLAKFVVPILLVLLYLHATCDLATLSRGVFGKMADNVESFACRCGPYFNSG